MEHVPAGFTLKYERQEIKSVNLIEDRKWAVCVDEADQLALPQRQIDHCPMWSLKGHIEAFATEFLGFWVNRDTIYRPLFASCQHEVTRNAKDASLLCCENRLAKPSVKIFVTSARFADRI
jgi:hypothetical protein